MEYFKASAYRMFQLLADSLVDNLQNCVGRESKPKLYSQITMRFLKRHLSPTETQFGPEQILNRKTSVRYLTCRIQREHSYNYTSNCI